MNGFFIAGTVAGCVAGYMGGLATGQTVKKKTKEDPELSESREKWMEASKRRLAEVREARVSDTGPYRNTLYSITDCIMYLESAIHFRVFDESAYDPNLCQHFRKEVVKKVMASVESKENNDDTISGTGVFRDNTGEAIKAEYKAASEYMNLLIRKYNHLLDIVRGKVKENTERLYTTKLPLY